MTTLEQFVSPALMRALGWMLLHSLWQGVVVAGVLAGALLLLRRQRAEVRYVISASALGAVVALAGLTFSLYLKPGGPVEAPGAAAPLTASVWAASTAATTSGAQGAAPDASASAWPSPQLAPAPAGAAPAGQRATAWLLAGLRYFDAHLPLRGIVRRPLTHTGYLLHDPLLPQLPDRAAD